MLLSYWPLLSIVRDNICFVFVMLRNPRFDWLQVACRIVRMVSIWRYYVDASVSKVWTITFISCRRSILHIIKVCNWLTDQTLRGINFRNVELIPVFLWVGRCVLKWLINSWGFWMMNMNLFAIVSWCLLISHVVFVGMSLISRVLLSQSSWRCFDISLFVHFIIGCSHLLRTVTLMVISQFGFYFVIGCL